MREIITKDLLIDFLLEYKSIPIEIRNSIKPSDIVNEYIYKNKLEKKYINTLVK